MHSHDIITPLVFAPSRIHVLPALLLHQHDDGVRYRHHTGYHAKGDLAMLAIRRELQSEPSVNDTEYHDGASEPDMDVRDRRAATGFLEEIVVRDANEWLQQE
jgi:hypothetical protein